MGALIARESAGQRCSNPQVESQAHRDAAEVLDGRDPPWGTGSTRFGATVRGTSSRSSNVVVKVVAGTTRHGRHCDAAALTGARASSDAPRLIGRRRFE
jgi:hypothetical protein